MTALIRNRIKELAGSFFKGNKEQSPMTQKEKWLIFLLAGLLLALVFWPETKKESTDDSAAGIFQSLNEKSGEESENVSARTDAAAEDSGCFAVTGDEEDYAEYLSRKLTSYLSQMDGAGQVEAWVTLKSGGQEVLYEEKSSQTTSLSEADSQGGTREETTEDVIRTVIFGADGNPYVVQTTLPEVQGVLVLAEGGDDSTVRLDIVEAVQALFDLDAHKIKVVKKKVEE